MPSKPAARKRELDSEVVEACITALCGAERQGLREKVIAVIQTYEDLMRQSRKPKRVAAVEPDKLPLFSGPCQACGDECIIQAGLTFGICNRCGAAFDRPCKPAAEPALVAGERDDNKAQRVLTAEERLEAYQCGWSAAMARVAEERDDAPPESHKVSVYLSADGSTLAFPGGAFTTVRACRHCGSLINGGPTTCVHCRLEAAEPPQRAEVAGDDRASAPAKR